MNEIKQLSWDSNFFGLQIGRVDCRSDELFVIYNKLPELKSKGYDLIYVFTDHAPSSLYQIMPIDVKRVYHKKIGLELKVASYVEFYNGSPEQLYDLAYQSGYDSRFNRDKNFREGEFERLYRQWIDNSVISQFADAVIIANINEQIAGFVTLSITDNVGSIGLLATDKNFRCRGVGSNLIAACNNYLLKKDIQELNVATQTSNENACTFYERQGMSVLSETDIYHFWL